MSSSVSGASLVVLGINYAPEVTGIAPYTTAVCRHLASLGADVTVITGVPHYPHWTVPPEYRRRLRSVETDAGVRVVRLRHHVPSTQSSLRRAAYEATWLAGALTVRGLGSADAVLAMTPPLASLPLARALSRRHRVPWAPIVMDLMGSAAAQSGVTGGDAVTRVVTRLEGSSFRDANLVGVIGDGFGQSVTRLGVPADRVRLVPNWTHVSRSAVSRDEARRALGWDPQEFLVVHTGNMGLKQGLDNVVDAARLADETQSPLAFVLVGDGNQRARLQEAGEHVSRLRFVPPVGDREYALVLAAADVLLVNEAPGVVEMSLPSKLTSYLAADRPVLAAVPDDGWTARALDASSGAMRVPAGEPAALLAAVRSLADDEAQRTLLAGAGAAYAAANLTPEAGLARYASLVQELLQMNGGRR